jgi:mannose-6-phosphate isomerase
MAGDGGELFQGTTAGTDQAGFEAALAEDRVEDCLNRFETSDGDFFFLPARTVHALGTGCLLVEVQQTSDITFRVSDWGRMGLDGKPRPLHVSESLATIDFSKSDHGPVKAAPEEHPDGGSVRRLVTCPYFTVEERRALRTVGGRSGQCSVVVNLSRAGSLATAGGRVALPAFSTVLVPAAAGPWTAVADGAEPLRLVVAHPV